MDAWRVFAISMVDFSLDRSSLPLAIEARLLFYDEFDGHTRRTAGPTRPSVNCRLLTRVGGLGAAAKHPFSFFVFFPVKPADKRNL